MMINDQVSLQGILCPASEFTMFIIILKGEKKLVREWQQPKKTNKQRVKSYSEQSYSVAFLVYIPSCTVSGWFIWDG